MDLSISKDKQGRTFKYYHRKGDVKNSYETRRQALADITKYYSQFDVMNYVYVESLVLKLNVIDYEIIDISELDLFY